jgi:hypothetical protein
MRAKWDAEKKSQKRVGVLEKRLREKIDEVKTLEQQVRSRDTLASTAAKAAEGREGRAKSAAQDDERAKANMRNADDLAKTEFAQVCVGFIMIIFCI